MNGRRHANAIRVVGREAVVRGKGLRPKVAIESLDFEAPAGMTKMKFHGLGIWKPIVAIFGGIARSAVRKMEFRTDIPSVLKGEILGGKKARRRAATPPPAATPTPAPSGAASGADAVLHGPGHGRSGSTSWS